MYPGSFPKGSFGLDDHKSVRWILYGVASDGIRLISNGSVVSLDMGIFYKISAVLSRAKDTSPFVRTPRHRDGAGERNVY